MSPARALTATFFAASSLVWSFWFVPRLVVHSHVPSANFLDDDQARLLLLLLRVCEEGRMGVVNFLTSFWTLPIDFSFDSVRLGFGSLFLLVSTDLVDRDELLLLLPVRRTRGRREGIFGTPSFPWSCFSRSSSFLSCGAVDWFFVSELHIGFVTVL